MSRTCGGRGTAAAPGEATTDRVHGIFSRHRASYDAFNRAVELRHRSRLAQSHGRGGLSDSAVHAYSTCAREPETSRSRWPTAVPIRRWSVRTSCPRCSTIAEQKAEGYTGPADLSFQIADAQDLPFDDESFDVVTVGFRCAQPARPRGQLP